MMRNTLHVGARLCLMGLGLLVATGAGAAKVTSQERLDRIEGEIEGLIEASEGLEAQVQPGRGFITEGRAVARFEDYVFLHLIGEYEQAAEGFYTLVTTASLSDTGLHWDAEWYLASSLHEMGNLRTAEANYAIIIEDLKHPFHDDAVRRLLEIYVEVDDVERFQQLYKSEIVSGRVRSTDLITYSVGKAFFQQGNYLEAKANLANVNPDSPYYRKATYIQGAVMVAEGELDQAVSFFDGVIDLSVETVDDRQLLDLSLLALGRIYLSQGRYEEAADYYGRIGGDSIYLADLLYELVWTFIKQNADLRAQRYDTTNGLDDDQRVRIEHREQNLVQEALNGVEIFLLEFPEHEYSANLQLLQGHLHIQAVEYDSALGAYEEVIYAYTPVRERFSALANSQDEPRKYFQELMALDGQQGAVAGQEGLPRYAMAMVMSDQDLSRALTVYRDLEHQRQNLEVSEGIIEELETVLSTATGIGGFDRLRYGVQLNRTLLLQKQLELLEVEEQALLVGASGNSKRDLQTLGAQRQALFAVAMGSSQGEAAGLLADIGSLRGSYKKLRHVSTDPATAKLTNRIDADHGVLLDMGKRLRAVQGGLSTLEASELTRIKNRFGHEVTEVGRQRTEFDATLHDAEQVSVRLTRAGFGRLEDFFAESVLRADVGIVDVYWAQKVEVSDERVRVIGERNALRSELIRRFDIVEQKLRM